MKKVSIKPQWTIRLADGQVMPPRLLDLLVRVHARGSLLAACQEDGLSYRHAWDLIRQGEAMFGSSLLEMSRGKGSRLTALGSKLVWADQRIEARLAPALASLASELETEIDRVLSDGRVLLRIHASHGFAIETLLAMLSAQGAPVEFKYCNSLEAPASLHDGACDLAGFHIPIGPMEASALQHCRQWLDPTQHQLVDIATRRVGLMVAPGNPLKLYELTDLTKPSVRFINRQRSSGTRFLLDGLLAQAGVDSHLINGFEQGEYTHAAVAAYVASGMADAGFGLETAARRFKLDFIPMVNERYFFLANPGVMALPAVQNLLGILRSAEFKARVDELPGYDARHAGRVLRLDEAFESLKLAEGKLA
jgi:molybdate transport repressor ModE-like protein